MKSHQAVVIRMPTPKCHMTPEPQMLRIWPQPYMVCPVDNLYRYLAIRPPGPGPLFCFPDGRPINRHDLACMLNKVTGFLHLPTEVIKLHSLQIGGAMYLYISGVSTDKNKCRGRWSSDCFKNTSDCEFSFQNQMHYG